MQMKKIILVSLAVMILFGSSAFAMQPAIIGGVRDGLAIGIMADSRMGRNFGMRIGVEANTGKQPLVAFLGGKFYLSNMGRMPMALGISGVGYFGDKTSLGFGISLILHRVFDVEPMFLELGVDVADDARANVQLGYKLY
jgi:hypothetical protein